MKTEEARISCGDVQLYGELHIPDVVPAPAILVCHGVNARGFHLLKIYKQLAKTACKNGFVSLVFDFRGCGRSTGKFGYGIDEQQDVKCSLNYLASRSEVSPDKLFIVGHSLGGAVALYASQNETRVKGLVLWSTPKNHSYNVKKFIARTRGKWGGYMFLVFAWLDRLFDVSRFYKLEVYGVRLRLRDVKERLMTLDGCEAASKVSGIPLLVIIGDDDDIVGVDEANELHRSAPKPKALLVIKSADHIYAGKEAEVIFNTLDWIKKWK